MNSVLILYFSLSLLSFENAVGSVIDVLVEIVVQNSRDSKRFFYLRYKIGKRIYVFSSFDSFRDDTRYVFEAFMVSIV